MNTVRLSVCKSCGVPHVPPEIAQRVRAGEEITIEIITPPHVAANVLQYGTGGLNIDGCRIGWGNDKPTQDEWNRMGASGKPGANGFAGQFSSAMKQAYSDGKIEVPAGRWPANVALTCCGNDPHDPDCAAAMLDAQSGVTSEKPRTLNRNGARQMEGWGLAGKSKGFVHGDTGGASRFFKVVIPDPLDDEAVTRFRYYPKASRSERNAGLEGMGKTQKQRFGSGGRTQINGEWVETHSDPIPAANHHPCVKPLKLMAWLVRMVTPPGGVVLDPFMGSGSTGVAAIQEGFDFVGIELDPDYCEIARRRMDGTSVLAKRPQQGVLTLEEAT